MKDNKDKPEPEKSREEIKNKKREQQKPKSLDSLENKLIESEERFKTLFEYAPDGYYISDLEGKLLDGNKAAEDITGYNRFELIGRNYFKAGLLTLKDVPKAVGALKRNRKGLSTQPQEFTLKRKDGKQIKVEISTYPLKINGGMVVLGIARDISRRKDLEHRLIQSEKEKLLILDSIPMPIMYHDRNYQIIWANKTACDSVKKKIKELKGKKCHEIWPEGEAPCEECITEKAWETGKTERAERVTAEGKHLLVTAIPIFDEEKRPVGAVETVSDITEIKQSQKKQEKTVCAIIQTISKIMAARDPYTAGHQLRVSQLAAKIAQELKLPQDEMEGVRMAALIHDIGKIGIPIEILISPAKLADAEYAMIKKHPQIGYDILKNIDFPYPVPVAQIVLQHQERLNGSGYPNRLKSEAILLEARIIAVADTVEAMSSHRPYRPALGIDAALGEIVKKKGILYDPQVVAACIRLFKEKGFKFK
jgi:PAS domain S-box-containing protein/putative nucleotidyltransferase with HDIG domain